MLRRTLLAAALATLGTPARADVIVPSSAFAAGKNGALFHTDLRVFNPTEAPALVVPVLYDQSSGETFVEASFTVPPREQVAFDNALESLFGRPLGAFGPIRLETSAPLLVSSSVNNVNACGTGAVSGQWLPGIDAAEAARQGELVQLALSADGAAGYRTNVVFMNPGTADAHVTATLRHGDGTEISSLALPPLGANGWTQLALGSAFPGAASVTDTNLFLEFTSDAPVLSFASVINNASGDPFAIVARSDPAQPPVAAFTSAPASPLPGQPVAFTDASTGGATAQLWDFGDGATATSGTSVTHTYAAAGTYHAVHFAGNVAGASAAEGDVVVAPASTEPVPIAIMASQWTYTPNDVTLHVGTKYQITWLSKDVMHGLGGLAALGIPGCDVITQTVACTATITPTASQVGTWHYACTQSSCGAGHSSMTGTLTIVSP